MLNLRRGAALARIARRLRPPLTCSFCVRTAEQVERLVAGAAAHICDDCIAKCLDILERHPKDPELANRADSPRDHS